MNNKMKRMTYAALLTAMAIIIPIQFGFLRIFIPPAFSATLASHVPMIMAMLISPSVAISVGIGSTLGFSMVGLPIPVLARAATHIIVGFIGAKILEKQKSYVKAILITAPIHALLEMLVVIPFIGITFDKALMITAIGTLIHHLIDSIIAFIILKSVANAKRTDIYNALK